MSTRAIPPLVALTADPDTGISAQEVSEVAAALQTQVVNDFAPVWHQSATVHAFPDEAGIPRGYWPVVVKRELNEPGALGYHTDSHRQPIAYVQAGEEWSVTASHELLEMLADPWGNRLVTCVDPRGKEHGRARVLVEVCDPCESFTYDVLGVKVSDFVEPSYYGSHRWGYGIKDTTPRATHLGVCGPLTLAKGGYLSWEAADGAWWQATFFDGAQPAFRNLGAELDAALEGGATIREAIDRITPSQRYIGAEG